MERTKILMFDDDIDLLELCTFVLGRKGYDIYTETSCTDLVQKVASVRPDIIFMDHWIDDGGGISATRRLKEHGVFNTIPVIYFTANDEAQELAKQAGADTYFSKPFDIKHLENIIAETLRTRAVKNIFRPLPGNITRKPFL